VALRVRTGVDRIGVRADDAAAPPVLIAMTSSALPDDADIIERSRREPEQFAVLFERHAPSVSRYVTRRVGPGLAEDIVADTFVAAFRQRGDYDLRRREARPWMFGIATNLIRRHWRDEVRELRAMNRVSVDPTAESFVDAVEDRVAAASLNSALTAAIASLDPKQRDVLLLVAWAELTYDQVAVALGIPEGTVRSRMNRARARLRSALKELDHG
jgi:RNA polymerase sigma factor (sigma-70 family)